MKVIQNLGRRHDVEPIEWTPYVGETVTVKTIIRGGKKIQETAYYEDTVKAVPRGNAYCIGNGPSRKGFDLDLLGSTGQTYGCNALYRDFIPDYLFSVDALISKKISEDKVYEKCVCYAPSLEVNRNQGLKLIPLNPHYTSGNQAIWTATVHGHRNIYLIGFDFREYGPGQLNNIYQGTEYYGERNGGDIFEAWYTTLRKIIKHRCLKPSRASGAELDQSGVNSFPRGLVFSSSRSLWTQNDNYIVVYSFFARYTRK